jgi:serine/threonine-protein kinase RsbW
MNPDDETTFRTCVIRSEIRCACIPKNLILQELQRHGFRDPDLFGLKLALEEALTNAVKHGNHSDPKKRVTVRYAVSSEKAVIIVRDEGGGFNPEAVPDCTSPDRLPLPNGRGIMLIRAYMDDVSYRDKGREIVFVKRRSNAETQCGCTEATLPPGRSE